MVRCRYCHRPLTDKRSLERGFGPVCAEAASLAPDLFSQPRSLRDVLAEDFGTSLEALAADGESTISAVLASEILMVRACS